MALGDIQRGRSSARQVEVVRVVRVGVVEDDAAARRVLEGVLCKETSFRCVGMFADGEMGLAQFPFLKPDLILTAIQLPGMSGIECCRRVKAVCPGSKVIMTTACADPDIVQEALVAGADGYLVKPFSRAKCRAAIQFAMADGFALGNHVKPAMLRGMASRPDSTTTLPGLSPRQHQILPLLRQGMRDKEIASQPS